VSDDDIAAAANRHREREAAIAAKQQRIADAERDPIRQRKYAEAMVTDALAGKGGDRLATAMAMIAVLGGGALGAVLLTTRLGSWSFLLSIPIMIGLLVASFVTTERIAASFSRRELARVRRGFEVGVYLEQLSHNRRDGVAVFKVRFAQPIQAERERQLCDAIKEWMNELASVTFADEILVARSAEQSCHKMITGSASGSGIQHEWTNRDVHTQVGHFIRRVLPHLDNVVKLDIEIEGETKPWSQEA
jgi:hypothetical protein